MPRLPHAKQATGLLCLVLIALGLAACGNTVSTSGFKGEQHAIAQTVANLQSDATAGDEKKICAKDLAAAVVKRLGGAKRCEKAIKDQLAEIDSLEAKVESIRLGAAGTTATARVKSTHAGKSRVSTVMLVKEGGKWKVSALQ
jgi:monoamine oxidase